MATGYFGSRQVRTAVPLERASARRILSPGSAVFSLAPGAEAQYLEVVPVSSWLLASPLWVPTQTPPPCQDRTAGRDIRE